jgi:CBS domain-containing protein
MDTKTVGDVMLLLDEYATIASGCTIREALVALSKAQLGLTYDRHQHRAVLVLDESGAVIGKLSHWGILRSLEPELLRGDDLASLDRAGLSADFIGRLKHPTPMFGGSLDRMCRTAARVRVEDAMAPVTESVSKEAPLSEAIRRFVALHAQFLLVQERGKVIGVLRLSDVFEEVADRIREGDAE